MRSNFHCIGYIVPICVKILCRLGLRLRWDLRVAREIQTTANHQNGPVEQLPSISFQGQRISAPSTVVVYEYNTLEIIKDAVRNPRACVFHVPRCSTKLDC